MGKARKIKIIRKIANELPEVMGVVIAKRTAKGSELINDGVSMSGGKPIDPDKFYSGKKKVLQPMNHYNEMKRVFYKHGAAGVVGYQRAMSKPVDFNSLS